MKRHARLIFLVALLIGAIALYPIAHRIGEPDNGGPITNGTIPPSSVPSSNDSLRQAEVRFTQVAIVDSPTGVSFRTGDPALYITEQAGRIRRVTPTPDPPYRVDDIPVLDITSLVTAGGERGLLGLAFSPDGSTAYVAFTNLDDNQELDGFTMVGDHLDLASRRTLLVVPDFASNHNGGDVLFGPDGNLYWTMGDGGGAGDPHRSGQDPHDLLGDILRIDPSHPSADKPYSIPPDNPFADGRGGAPEVWMYGLRNPWRISFNRQSGDLWIADVGQGNIEEIDFMAAPVKGGANFGWSDLEGTHPFHANRPPQGAIAPVYEYDHSGGRCSITGGYPYMGSKLVPLIGTYLFADYCEGELQGLTRAPDGSLTVTDLGARLPGVTSFGEDAAGELYAVSGTGAVDRVDGRQFLLLPNNAGPATTAPPASPDDPTAIAHDLVDAEHVLRTPTSTPQALDAAAHSQQLAYRTLGRHAEWDAAVLAAVPSDLHDAVVANIDARRELAAIPGPPLKDTVPAWRIDAPAPAGQLLDAYHEGEQQFGVGWNYLAAINLIESDMGRIHGLSTAGAQGPMQFMPSTWDAYGGGGDIDSPRDSIIGAARYLAHNGFADGNVDGALYRYNNSDHYVNAIKDIASVLAADPNAYAGYYRWEVFYATTAGVVHLPVGYVAPEPIPVDQYLAAHPDALQ